MKQIWLGCVLLATGLSGAVFACPPSDADWIARGKTEMVAADSEFASKAGLEILKAGGNAIDAAVAVSFALAVTRPYSTGPGGGGFMIARFADGRIIVEDFRETAPAAATPDMYVEARRNNPDGPSPSEFGHLAVAVPGLVAGRCQALAQWGTMPLAKVLQPAIRLARDGYAVDDDYVRATREVLETYEKHPALKDTCGYVYRTHLGSGKLRQAEDRLVQPELARLLEALAVEGADFFYKGVLGKAVAEAVKQNGGILTQSDMAGYAPKMRDPILCTYREYQLILMPLPSSGGIAIGETLNIYENFPRPPHLRFESFHDEHILIEAMKHAFADRAFWLGDRDFVEVPTKRLLSKEYAATLSRRIDIERTREINLYGSVDSPRDSGTSHFCIVDRFGNAVVSTETINTYFGSLAAIEEWGLILNNEMDDFTTEPGKSNAFGLVQSTANAIEPGKRPLSSMSPTIVLHEDEPVFLLGASGGPGIISSVLNVFLYVVDLHFPLQWAIGAPRPHHQWQPDLVYFDRDPHPDIAAYVIGRGHKLADQHKTGVVQAILRDGEGWIGASDPRKGGKPAGD